MLNCGTLQRLDEDFSTTYAAAMGANRNMEHAGELLFLVALYFFVPIFITRVLMGASWKAILVAYGVWIGCLILFGVTSSKSIGEVIGWPLIMGMFLTIPALPIVILVLRLFAVR